ncbi:MAG: hypothetical protein CSA05_01760 [Bacteroidia bacterium]|nr:MAG: hypothetical protein CSA05_01760 [Bacteroidia bacterium]
MKIVIQIILAIGVFILSFLLYKSIEKPIEFNKEKNRRYEAVIQRLKDIRTAQVAYKSVKGEYTAHFDTLIDFLKQDSFPLVRKKGSVPDSLIEQLKSMSKAEAKALELGIISRDTSLISVKDSLFGAHKRPGFNVDRLKFIPFTNGIKFAMGAGEIETGSKVKVKVFEAKAPNHVILNGMDRQEIINLNEAAESLNKYKGLRVGSLEEATNNAGNWE